MSKTVEGQITELIAERMRQHLVCNYCVFIPEGSRIASVNAVLVSGEFVGEYPRSFEIKSADSRVTITEVTLFADLGINAPSNFIYDEPLVIGAEISIPGSGISFSLAAGVLDGDEWMLRLGNAYATVSSIVEHPFEYDGLPVPSLAIYLAEDKSALNTSDCVDYEAEMFFFLTVSKEMFESGIHQQIVGDIKDCIFRDSYLWNNETCLANDFFCRTSEYFDRSNNGNSTFRIQSVVKYRTELKNSRSVK